MRRLLLASCCVAALVGAVVLGAAAWLGAAEIESVQQGTGFTCPMHPDVRQPTPGKCPKCGMDLMPATKADAAKALKAGDSFKVSGGTATVREVVSLPLVNNWCSERFAFDCHGKADLEQLRKQEKLDDVLAKGKSEFEKQLLLMGWAHKRIKLFGSPTKPEAKASLEILAAVDQGHAFNCAYYERLLRDALKSCGYVARDIGLKGAKSDGNGTGHGVTEIWSNEHRKWVILDPTLNVHFATGGVPLNAYEIRQEWFYNDGKDLEILIGTEPKKYARADMPIDRGTHKGFGTLRLKPESVGKFLFVSYTPSTPDGGPDYGKMFITKDKLCDGIEYHTRRNPDKPAEEPYFPVQQVDLRVLPWDATSAKVWALTLTPDFKTFRYRLDGKDWSDGGANLTWTLHHGENTLEAATVNKFGIQGAVSKVVIDVK